MRQTHYLRPFIKVWRGFALYASLLHNNTFGVLFLQPLPNVMLGNFPVNRTNSITQIVFQAITNVIKKKIATMVQMNKLAVSTFCHDLSFKFQYETFLWKSTIFLHMSNIKKHRVRVMGGNYLTTEMSYLSKPNVFRNCYFAYVISW